MTKQTTSTETHINAEEVKKGQEKFLWPCVGTYYKEPIVMVEAEGLEVTGADGKNYLDFFSGILTTSIGHCHPHVVARVQEQVAKLGHTSTLYQTENQVNVACHLAELAPGDLQQTFFTNSGSEAVETAIMMAQIYTGRSEVIALRHAYSGRTTLTTNITAHASWRPLATSIPGIKHARSPYPYRSPFGDQTEGEMAQAFADDLEEVIHTTTTGAPACFIAEPIQGVGGFIVPPKGYLERAAAIIRDCGGFFIADEVQTGFGRTGKHWFGIEHAGVEPDIMTMAKGIASGYPVGATITTKEIASSWTGKSISTFGGNPISMAGAEATLDVMQKENTPMRSAIRGEQLRDGLGDLQSDYGWIGEVRGKGLMQALELVKDRQTKKPNPEAAQALLEAAKQQGLLIGLGGLNGQVVRLGPSMLVSEGQVDKALQRLHHACDHVDRLV